MHLIATGGGASVTDTTNDEPTSVDLPDEQSHQVQADDMHEQLPEEHMSDEHDAEQEADHEEEPEPEPEHEPEHELEPEHEPEQEHEHEHEHELEQEQEHEPEHEPELEHEQEQDQDQDQEQQQLPLVQAPSLALPMETEQPIVTMDDPQQQPPPPVPPPPPTGMKTTHDIAEIHRDMLNLIPIPQAWSHIRHQSGLFSYPDLPHFNVIRQATFRDGRFVCPFCTVDFASKEGIRYHLYNSCTKSPYPKAFFRCLMCGSELADRSSLRTHLARHVNFECPFRCTFTIAVAFFSRVLSRAEAFLRTRSMSRASQQ